MNYAHAPKSGSVMGLVCSSLLFAGCSDSSGPVVDPAFDPAFAVAVVDGVMAALETTEVQSMMGNINFTLAQAASDPVAGGSAAVPGAGGTYVFDEGDLAWKVDPDRAGAPAEGVRFIWYTMDTNAHSPIRPLNERGWIDLVLEESSETEASMDVTFVLVDDGESSVAADFSITYQEDTGGDSFQVLGEGTAGGVAFDIERSFTLGEEGGLYTLLVSFGGEAGLLAASVEVPFDPVSGTATVDPHFVGSVLADGHYLLVEADWEDETGNLAGTVEADDEIVLELVGTTTSPTFRLPTGGAPALEVQTAMGAVWAALRDLLGDGVGLVAVLEGLYR